jgi:rRNA processing protein Gar1
VIYPEKPKNIENLPSKNVGKVSQIVGDLLIIEANLKETYEVVDLDGWVCDNNKNFIGFVIDVFGKIENPFYAIKPEEGLQNLQDLMGKEIFYIEGTKILNGD